MKMGIHSLCHSQLDWESILFVIPDLIGDPLFYETSGFPLSRE
jgi:hypothetical protein